MKLLVTASLIMAILAGCAPEKVSEINSLTPFGICYTKLDPDQVGSYKMVVVEPDFYTRKEILELKKGGTTIVAYATLGEVDPNRWYFGKMEELGFRGKNDVWNSYYMDLDKSEVREMILAQVLPEIMAKGVDGLFLDTIDAVSPETERGDMKSSMAELIKSIRAQYPNKIIIQNAGLFLLDQTGNEVDAFLTESLASNYDFGKQEYLVRSDSAFNTRLGYLNEYEEQSGVPFMVLDYADSQSHLNQIKSRLDTLGRPYFISNIALNRLPTNTDSVTNGIRKEGS